MKFDKKAFTLIELLAVIAILGVIMTIVVPSVINYTNKAKKDAFVMTSKQYISAIKTNVETEEYQLPTSLNEVTIIPISSIKLEKGSTKSTYGGNWIGSKSYVAILNNGTESNPSYTYYFAAQDDKKNAIPLTIENSIETAKIISDAKDTMEMTIQSLSSGSEPFSINQNPATIIGLPDITTRGPYLYWTAIIYNAE